MKSATYFLVDPLDGTQEFIAGRDEYTVNIGLDFRRHADPRHHCGAGAGSDLARHRRPRRRAARIFVGHGR